MPEWAWKALCALLLALVAAEFVIIMPAAFLLDRTPDPEPVSQVRDGAVPAAAAAAGARGR